MKQLFVAIAILPFAFATTAYAVCDSGSAGGRCTRNGHQGTMECVGQRPICVVESAPHHGNTTPAPPPVHATVKPKYYILTVVYAPPGTNGGKSTSIVNYAAGSTTGATLSTTGSFKAQFIGQVSFGGEIITGVSDTIGANFTYSGTATHTDSVLIEKSANNTIQVAGPGSDGVDHDHDLIYLWLNPAVDVGVTPTSATWALTGTSDAVVQYVYVGALKDPTKMPPGVTQLLEHYGITTADYPGILKHDPFEAGPLLIRPIRVVPHAPFGTPQVQNQPPLDPARFQSLHLIFPYEPPFSATDPVPTMNVTLSNADTTTGTGTATDDIKVGVTNSTDLAAPGAGAIKASLKSDDSWDWTNSSTKTNTTKTIQTAAVTIGGPAFGYTGPTAMEVYYDTIYKTFAFRPFVFSTDAFHGRLLARDGKPLAWKEVALLVKGTKYRTYTDARGQYRFFGDLRGPLKLQYGASSQAVSAIPRAKVVDFKLTR